MGQILLARGFKLELRRVLGKFGEHRGRIGYTVQVGLFDGDLGVREPGLSRTDFLVQGQQSKGLLLP